MARVAGGVQGHQPPRLQPILEEMIRFVRGYLVLPGEAEEVSLVLWAAHTWVFDVFDASPYLYLRSPVKRAGKTRALEILELLVARPWRVVEPSEAVLFRKISRDRPTLLLDEADALFGKAEERTEALRGLLNAGNRRGARVPRCMPPTMEVREFEVFCPKALAGIGELPDTVQDRAVTITLHRATADEQRGLRRFRLREAEAEARPIREALAAWSSSADVRARLAEPVELPPELDGRAADAWEPLLAVAREAGGWFSLAWAAALKLSGGRDAEDEDLGVRLLRDLQAIFEETGAARLTTRELVEKLAEDETSPWADWRGTGRAITPQALGRLLRRFGVAPRQWREGARGGLRGYCRADLEPVWARYASSPSLPPGSEPLRPLQSSSDAGSSHLDELLHGGPVAVQENGRSPRNGGLVASVAAPPPGEEEGAEDEGVPPDQRPPNLGDGPPGSPGGPVDPDTVMACPEHGRVGVRAAIWTFLGPRCPRCNSLLEWHGPDSGSPSLAGRVEPAAWQAPGVWRGGEARG